MTNQLLPAWLDDIWAKSPEEEGKPGESLAEHTLQVLKRLSDMVKLRPFLPEKIKLPSLWNILFWGCFLHDFGKAAKPFQEMLRGNKKWSHRHEVLSLAFIDWLGDKLNEDEKLWIAATIAYHHKDLDEISLLYNCLDESLLFELTNQVDIDILKRLWRWLKECSSSWIDELSLDKYGVYFPGVISVDCAVDDFNVKGAETISKYQRKIRRWDRDINRQKKNILINATLIIRGHINTCDYTASAHVGPFIEPSLSSPDDLLKKWKMHENQLYPHQYQCMNIQGSAVLIAPTGSGKTEAALLWACSQRNDKMRPPRTFYTLPFQASMNAMYNRLQKCFPDGVGLEHSHSTLALYRRFLEGYDKKEAMKLAKLAKTLSNLHYFPIRVMSPYQMLKAPYRLKGYEALLTDYFGALFIFDEIHAYDVKRLASILATISYLKKNFHADFFMMTATLPGILLDHLKSALEIDTHNIIQATPDLFNNFKRHRLIVREGDLLQQHWMEIIEKDIKNGQSVLICCNTVKRAQMAYREMSERLKGEVEVVMLHSRFNSRDRLKKERIVQDATGCRSSHRKPIVLVSTQVVEVSLDIDMDAIYTDPAPLEALIQRFGRVNRRRKRKWAPVNVFTEPSDGQHIYDKELVQRSLAVIKKNDDKIIDEGGISNWLNEVYVNDIAQRWEEDYEEEYDNFKTTCLDTLHAFDTNENLEELFYQAFDSIEVLPACMEDEYKFLMENGEPLEASQLLVPLSWGQFCKLRKNGMVKESKDDFHKIVDIPYNSEIGMLI